MLVTEGAEMYALATTSLRGRTKCSIIIAMQGLAETEVLSVVKCFADDIRSRLGRGVESVVLFGSHSRGAATSSSDVDVAIFLSDEVVLRHAREQASDAAYDFVLSGTLIRPIVLRNSRSKVASLLRKRIQLDGREVR